MLSDISDFNNNSDLLYLFTAVTIVDLSVIYLARNTNIFGTNINIWYNKFGISAVILDIFIIIIGLIITRYIFLINNFSFSPLLFIIIAVSVQLIHDYLFYAFVISPTPYGVNNLMDVYKDYAKEGGFKILGADSAMVIASALIAMYLKSVPSSYSSSLLILSIYLIPYLLFQN
jgi:polyferredoxin